MPELTRRRALGAAAALAAGAAAQTLTASSASASPNGPATARRSTAEHHHGGPEAFDEVYQGRRIEGRPVTGGGHHHGGGYAVFIDGVELHVMTNADGSWISVVSHYAPVPTPRAAARAAVVELQGAPLVPFAAN
ncbi:apotyrosinase chaperone MelC1 [Streptomyces sp. NPDC054766]|uniref:apotyrosinase chaperone MelC1 n=1 Tax=Streptomyces rhizosphaerihabitans TaxID=1266770 RepID=UPI0021C19B11|nr:tyrosinase cofactor [Streptomyces rhizosphaerihabitans]MCT9009105.1 tyrosinase cofactor [Streptomyces rhizosphaerihabitans]